MQTSNLAIASRNHAADPGFEPVSLIDLLCRRAAKKSNKHGYIFLADGKTQEVSMTYRDLDLRARAIGAWIQSVGATDERVLLLFPSGLEFIEAFFGCIYARAVAVPAYPPRPNRKLDRIQAISNDARPALVLTTSHLLSRTASLLGEIVDLKATRLQTVEAIEDGLAAQWQEPVVAGHTLAFLQYTSGSTATPKGVMVTHGNLLHNQRMIEQAFGQTEESIIVGWLPLFHDMGLIGNLLQALQVGAKCILLSPESFLQRPLNWLEAVSRYRATTSGGPNFAFELCARKVRPEQLEAIDLSSWHTAFCGAEPVRKETLDRFAAVFEPCGFHREAFYPCYGLAEATLFVSGGRTLSGPTVRSIDRESLEQNQAATASDEGPVTQSLVSCGKAWMGQRIKIVDPASGAERPAGQVGEIWVSGPSVAKGYWNRPEESNLAFQAYLEGTGEGPFLRTGDLGFIEDEEIYVTGRLKDLIIIRGRNHYPQDIEFTVERCHPAMRPGCGAAFSVEIASEERLAVFQEIERRRQQDDLSEIIAAVRSAVAEDHDIEAYVVILGKIGSVPKTSSGKVRRQACREAFLAGALSAIEISRANSSGDAQSDSRQYDIIREEILTAGSAQERQLKLERYIQAQVARTLGIAPSQLSPQQVLVRLGLDSIKAMELQNSIENSLNVFLPMASFLQDMSVSQLASLVADSTPVAPTTIQYRAEERIDYPLSYGQQRLWFLDQLEPGNPAYNIPTVFRLLGHLNHFALEQAVSEIVARHQVLRATFKEIQGRPIQVISPLARVTIPVVDFVGAYTIEIAVNAFQLAAAEAKRSFGLARGPLLRVTLLRLSEEEHLLLLTLHHIIGDAWSLRVFLQELSTLYADCLVGNPYTLSELPAQYVDFAVWQRSQGELFQAQLSYWKAKFAPLTTQLELPVDRARPAKLTNRGACHWFKLPIDLSNELRSLSHREGTTLFMTLLAGIYVALHHYTGQGDISVGSPIAGRNRAEFEKLIGFFVSTLVLRIDLSDNPTFRGLLSRVRKLTLDAYANQDLPFEQLVSVVAPERHLSRSPLYQVWFGLHMGPLPTVTLAEATMIPVETDSHFTKVDLAIHLAEMPDGITGKLEYNRDLFEKTTIVRLAKDFRAALENAVKQPDLKLSALEETLGSRRDSEAENYKNALYRKLNEARWRSVSS